MKKPYKTDIHIRFGQRVRRLRIKRGFTQKQVSLKTGLSIRYIQRIEGKKPPFVTIDTIGKIAKAFEISPRELLERL